MEHKQVSLNVEEAKEFLRHIISNNRHLQKGGRTPVACELEGSSGIGKTSITLQLAQEMGLDMVKLSLSQIEELGDLVGFPVKQFEMCKEIVKKEESADKKIFEVSTGEQECIWVDDHATVDMSKQNYHFTGRKRMSYCPPEWIADKVAGGILLLDDYSRADTRFLQAVMELIDRQTYISWKLPKDWHILLTSNPDNGDYLVNVLDTAQKTRFISVNLKFDIDCWATWAEEEGIDGRCINFLLMNPELVTEKCNARSITTFFNSISSFKDFSKELPMVQMIGEGSVGVEFSTMFTSFINNRLDLLVSPKVMLEEKDWSKVKKVMKECIGHPYRADIASVLTTRIVNYSLLMASNGAVPKEVLKRLQELMTDTEVLANDLRYLINKNLLGRDHAKFQTLMLDKEVMKMSIK